MNKLEYLTSEGDSPVIKKVIRIKDFLEVINRIKIVLGLRFLYKE